DAQRVGQQRLAQAAVFLRNHQAEQAHLAHLVDDRLRIGVGALQLGRIRNDFLLDELPYRGDDFILHVGQADRLGEFGHEGPFASSVTIVFASVRRLMSAELNPSPAVSTSTVSPPNLGAASAAKWLPSQAVGSPGAR